MIQCTDCCTCIKDEYKNTEGVVLLAMIYIRLCTRTCRRISSETHFKSLFGRCQQGLLKEKAIPSTESELMQLTSTISLEARKRGLAFEQQHIDPTENDILLEDNRKLIFNRTRNIKIKYLITRFNFGHGCIC